MIHAIGLLDTSVIIALSHGLTADALPRTPLICVVTLAELSVGPLVATTARECARRQAVLQEVESVFDPLPIDAGVARAFGRVASDLRSSGKKVKARVFDALIAAVAVSSGLPLFTQNAADYVGITDLEVVPVPQKKFQN